MKLLLMMTCILMSFSSFAQTVINLEAGSSARINAGQRVVVKCSQQDVGTTQQYEKHCNCDVRNSINVDLVLYRLDVNSGKLEKIKYIQYFGGTGAEDHCRVAMSNMPLCN